MEYLDIFDEPQLQDDITRIQMHTYSPHTSSFNRNDEIRLSVNNQDALLLPHKAALYVEGEITNTSKPNTIPLTNNFIGFLFDILRVEIHGVQVSETRNVGITSTIKHYSTSTLADDIVGKKSCWFAGMTNLDKGKGFSYLIPMRHFSGFFETFRGILINPRLEITLLRSKSDENCFMSNTADATLNINLTKIQLRIPHVHLSDSKKLMLYKAINDAHKFSILFREHSLYEFPVASNTSVQSWTIRSAPLLERPRFVVIGFATNRKNNVKANASKFDHCSITNVRLFLNDIMYPYDTFKTDFDNDNFAIAYHAFNEFKKSYHNNSSEVDTISMDEFKSSCPFHIIDGEYQNEMLKSGSIDVRVEFEASKAIPDNTTCYAMIIHDKFIKYDPLNSTVERIL